VDGDNAAVAGLDRQSADRPVRFTNDEVGEPVDRRASPAKKSGL